MLQGTTHRWSQARGTVIVGAALALALGTAGGAVAQEADPEVIRTIEGVTIQGPWLVYDSEACTFNETDEHPDAYVSEL
jgi:hypothetical protein